jgi:hypothetical protein
MNDFKEYWIAQRNHFVVIAEDTKDSQSVSFNLLDIYDRLTDEEKLAANDILAEWLISDDNTLRYDAGFIISQRSIKALKGALKKAIIISRARTGPEAVDEVENFERILKELNV